MITPGPPTVHSAQRDPRPNQQLIGPGRLNNKLGPRPLTGHTPLSTPPPDHREPNQERSLVQSRSGPRKYLPMTDAWRRRVRARYGQRTARVLKDPRAMIDAHQHRQRAMSSGEKGE